MTGQDGTMVGSTTSLPSDEVELHLLLPARQLAALRATADRLELTVAGFLRGIIGSFLQSPAVERFIGEEARWSRAPDVRFRETP
jgi:hypothetical protein